MLTREQRIFYFFSLLIAFTTVYYSYVNYFSGVSLSFCLIQGFAGLLMLINMRAFRWHRNQIWASYVLSILAGYVILTAAFHGGASGTGIFWAFAYPAASFLFLGVRNGLRINIVFIGMIVAAAVLSQLGVVTTYYPAAQLREAVIASLVVALLGFISQLGHERLSAELSNERSRLKSTVDSLPVGVVLVSASNQEIQLSNNKADELIGKELKAGISLEDCVKTVQMTRENGEPFLLEDLPISSVLRTGKSSDPVNLFILRPDGNRIVLRCTSAPLLDPDGGSITGAVSVLEDMTREHETSRLKTELVSLASHQLKTPLTSIKWSVEELLEEQGEEFKKEQKDLLKDTISIVDRLIALVKDLLSVSRIETGRKFDVVRKQVDVIPVLKSVMDEHAEMAKRNGVKLIASSLPDKLTMYVDEGKFRELFMNLIGNAIKYSKSGGKVEVGHRSDIEGGETIFVKDNGIGIPEHEQSKIFSRFYRATNVPDEMEGTGLGLYIAKVIVERHGGNLWFRSKEGEGTTFFAEFR